MIEKSEKSFRDYEDHNVSVKLNDSWIEQSEDSEWKPYEDNLLNDLENQPYADQSHELMK